MTQSTNNGADIGKKSILLGFLILAFVILWAAITNNQSQREAPPTETTISQPSGQSVVVQTPSPTSSPNPSPVATNLPPEEGQTQAAPIVENAPITRFVFPTPNPPPHSAWRPPLYDVPWATSPHEHFYFIRPIYADEVNWPTGNYRYGGVFFENVVHTGVDIAASQGSPIIAAGSGKVIWAGYGLYSSDPSEEDPYGLAVVIRHDFGYNEETLYTLYGHMSRIDVTRGQTIQTGDLLGEVGDTGFTTGPHLHFEVRLGINNFFSTYNPELWVAPPQGWGVLAGRVMGTGGQLLSSKTLELYNFDTRKTWQVVSYDFAGGINSDPYFQENLVIGDLPEGNYQLKIEYLGIPFRTEMYLQAGKINYFTFTGRNGFSTNIPASPEPEFTPEWVGDN